MTSVFELPEKYRVKKELGKERYLRLGNLSPAERKYIEVYANSIDILYDIPFQDSSEMVVISSEIELPVLRRRYFCLNYAKAIAQSVPYYCLVIIRYRSTVKLYAFDKRFNLNDQIRMVVTEFFASPDAHVTDIFYRLSIQRMQDAVNDAVSAKALNEKWIDEICYWAGGYDHAREYALEEARTLWQNNEEIQEQAEKNELLDRILDDECIECTSDFDEDAPFQCDEDDDSIIDIDIDDDEQDVYSLYEDEPEYSEADWEWLEMRERNPEFAKCYPRATRYTSSSDIYNRKSISADPSEDEKLFIRFCMMYNRKLYWEACKTAQKRLSTKIWMKQYIDACNEYAENLFNKSLDSTAVRAIRNAFSNEYQSDEVYQTEVFFDADELRSLLDFDAFEFYDDMED